MEAIKIIALCILAGAVYGILHDQVTVRVCLEYFTVFHPNIFHTQSPTLLALGWGVLATWWVSIFLGIMLVIAARAGYEPYGLASVLQTLATVPSSDADMALLLKTHPSPNDRLIALEQKLPPWFDTLAKPNPALVRFNQTFKPATASNN